MSAGDDDRVVVPPIASVQRYAGQVQGREHVGVAELGGERDTEHVEVTQRAVPVDRELGDALAAQQRLHVRPHGVRALGQGVRTLVDDLVQDHDALVGQTDLVGVGVHQGPPRRQLLALGTEPAAVPVLDRGVELTADVLDRFAHLFQQRLQAMKKGDAEAFGGAQAFGHAFKSRARPAHP